MENQPELRAEMLTEFRKNRKSVIPFLATVIIVSIAIIALAKILFDSSNPNIQQSTTTDSLITFQQQNIPTIRLGHYALWAETPNTEPVLVKRFNAINSQLVSLNGETLTELPTEDLNNNPEIFITIEQEGDRDEIPSQIIFMQGNYQDGQYKLIFDQVALSKSLNGTFILATPTDGNNNINEASGVWFTNPDASATTLDLPDIESSNWRYSSQLTSLSDLSLDLGLFRSAGQTDNISIYSKTDANSFPYPGEDMLRNLPEDTIGPLNLANGNYTIRITIEPIRNNEDFTGDLPFIPILEAKIPLNTKPKSSIELNNIYKVPTIIVKTSTN